VTDVALNLVTCDICSTLHSYLWQM